MSELFLASRVRLSPRLRLQWEKAQDAHVLLYPEGMVQLNESAALILGLCDGTRTGEEIVHELTRRFDSDELAADIQEFLGVATHNGWIVDA